jgi:hypothetical protein
MKLVAFFSVLLAIFFTTNSALASPKYKIVDLGIPAEATSSYATSINDKGQVCGYYYTKTGTKVFFWDPRKGLVSIPCDSPTSYPIINNNGVVVGSYRVYDEKKNYQDKIFQWDKRSGFVDIWIKTPGNQQVLDINNTNQVLFHHTNDKNQRSLYVDDLPLDDLFYDAKINDASKIFGFENGKNGIILKVYDLKTCAYEDICFFKGLCSIRGFNNDDIAIGEIVSFGGYGDRYGFTWSPQKGLELSQDFFPICFNDKGQIVGVNLKPLSNRGGWEFTELTVLEDGRKTNINKSLEIEFDQSTPWSCIYEIREINNQGQMVGIGIKYGDPNSQHAILLSPLGI